MVARSSTHSMLNATENGTLSQEAESGDSVALNGKLPAFKDLTIQ